MQEHANENDGIRYLLTVIDGLSKYPWVRPSCDITAVFGLLRDTAVTYSYKKKSPRRIGFFRDTRKISFGDFI